jgi:glycerol dehydrogenase
MHHPSSHLPSIIGFPAVYIQGQGALAYLRRELKEGLRVDQALVVVDPVVAHLFTPEPLLDEPKVRFDVLHFGGECTETEVTRLCDAAALFTVQAVVGAGGGKALDVSKAIAQRLNLPLIMVPTVASSDAPTSRLIALYDESHRIVSVPTLRRNPDVILVDTAVIAKAPRRLFVAGIGDAITKRYEVANALRSGIINYCGGRGTGLSLLLAEEAYKTLRQDSKEALRAHASGEPNEAFERVVEATVLYSGLAFESGGLSIAHGLLRGLTALSQTQSALHGELVAYGLLVQLHVFRHDVAEIQDLIAFFREVGLPIKASDIGLDTLTPELALGIGEKTMTAPYVANSQPEVTPHQIAQALLAQEMLAA